MQVKRGGFRQLRTLRGETGHIQDLTRLIVSSCQGPPAAQQIAGRADNIPFGGVGHERVQFGNNLSVLRERIPDESVDLIYNDPPFNSSRNFSLLFKDRTGRDSQAQSDAFDDTWSWTDESEAAFKELVTNCPNLDLSTTIETLRTFLHETPMMAYIVAMVIRLLEMHRVLKSTGSMALHCDATANHYLKIILDVIFGPRNFSNHITWKRNDTPFQPRLEPWYEQ